MRWYTVLYRWPSRALGEPYAMPVQADNVEHAEEQFENAYPNCEILWVVETDDVEEAMFNYYNSELCAVVEEFEAAAHALGECDGAGHGQGWGDPNTHEEGDHCTDRERRLKDVRRRLLAAIRKWGEQ